MSTSTLTTEDYDDVPEPDDGTPPPEAKKPKLGSDTIPNKALSPVKRKTHFIGIHLGAGTHSLKMNDVYKTLCKSACEAGLRILRKGGTADEAATAATVVLENSGFVNAGRGSNLSMDKTVELDAGFMNGNGDFGGVGAVEGVPNPILIARRVAQLQNPDNKLSCGLVPPMFLVGPGARRWAVSQQIHTCDPGELVSTKALKRHAKYMKKIADAGKAEKLNGLGDAGKADKLNGLGDAGKAEKLNGLGDAGTAEKLNGLGDAGTAEKVSPEVLDGGVSDTVGVIALDHANNVAATVSSGGNWLKFPGRIGHSPQYGAGCWAMNRGPRSEFSVAVSTTGVGEMLAKVQWARTCGTALLGDDKFNTPVSAISSAIKDDFLESDLLQDRKEPKVVGMIGLTWDGHRGEVVWGHSSQSLVVGLGGSGLKRVKTIFSTLSPKSADGAFKVEGMII